MVRHVSRFQLMMAVTQGKAFLVDLSNDGSDTGVYAPRLRNDFGSAILARGTRVEMENLLVELGASKQFAESRV